MLILSFFSFSVSSFFCYWIYLFEMGFGPLGTSCSLALKNLFCHFNGGRGARERPPFGPCSWRPWPVSLSAISFLELCVLLLPSLAEAATMVFSFLAPSLFEVKGEKLCSRTAIVKWETKSKEKKRAMQLDKGDIASPAMQNDLPYKNHPRSYLNLYGESFWSSRWQRESKLSVLGKIVGFI